MKTSTAEKHGYVCPKCKDGLTRDDAGRGYVKHKNNPHCDFEKGQKDIVPSRPTASPKPPPASRTGRTPMTVEGAKKLREELAHLKKVVRPKIVKAIAEAREHGDLRENAEYHAAKEQQGLTEARIRLIEARVGNAQIIDIVKIPATGNVVFGATVTLVDLETDGEVRYKIVGEDEADLKANKISIMSPLARAMIGKAEGDTLVVETPQGRREYEVDTVLHI